jgi:propanediol dehydratase-reactivating factor small subunit
VKDRPEPPVVVVRHAGAPAGVLREVRAGAEEEGVPTRVDDGRPADVVALAHAAALDSPLEVGVGIDPAGGVAVHHAALPADRPALTVAPGAGPPQWRRAGAVAARIVTGLPIA